VGNHKRGGEDVKNLPIIILALVVIIALSAWTAGTASATICAQVAVAKTGWHKLENCSDEPPAANQEYIKVRLAGRRHIAGNEYCVEVTKPMVEEGEYANNKCEETEPGKDWIRVKIINAPPRFLPPIVVPQPMTIKGGTTKLYDSSSKIQITCTSMEGKGEITGEQTLAKVTLTYKKCSGTQNGSACTIKSVGAGSEEILTDELKGELGSVKASEAESEAGILYTPATGSELIRFEGTCGPSCPGMVTGGMIGEIPTSALLTESSTSELKFLETSENQIIQELEGTKDTLTAFGTKAAIEGTQEFKFEESVAIS
jgi:hypothetical protein